CCIEGGVGARIEFPGPDLPPPGVDLPPPGVDLPLRGVDLPPRGADLPLRGPDAALFGEGPGGAVVAGPQEAVHRVPGARVIGEVGGDSLDIVGALDVPVTELRAAYEGAIPAAFAAT
ncbi:MAG: hypothetical protein ACRDLD_00420, partial [Thermoleophilaceae bacterium]